MPKTISTRLAIEGESEYKRALKDCNDELKLLQSELVAVSSEYEDNADSMEAVTAKGATLEKMYEAQQQKVETLREAMENARSQQEQYGENIEELKGKLAGAEAELEKLQNSSEDTTEAEAKLKEEIAALSRDLEENEKKYDAAGKAADDWQKKLNYATADMNKAKHALDENNKALEKTEEETQKASDGFSDINKATDGLTSKMGALGGVFEDFAAGGLAGTIAGLGAASAAAYKFYSEFEKGSAVMAQATGATGEALRELNQAAIDVYATADVGTIEEISAAVGELNTRLGIQGDQLREVGESFALFAEVTGTDAKTAVVDVTKAMKNWGVDTEDASVLLDKLTVAAQASGISVSTLTQNLSTNRAALQSAGYSLDDAIALFSQMEREGLNASTMITGLRKAVQNFSEEGVKSADGIRQLNQRIRDAASEQEAWNIAAEYYGERVADELLKAIREGRLEIDAMAEALANAEGAMERTEKASDTLEERLSSLWRGLKGQIGQNLNTVIAVFERLGGAIAGTNEVRNATPLAQKTQETIRAIMGGTDALRTYESLMRELSGVESELATNTANMNAAQEDEITTYNALAEAIRERTGADDEEIARIIEKSESYDGLNQQVLENMGIMGEEAETLMGLVAAHTDAKKNLDTYTDAVKEGEEAVNQYNTSLLRVRDRAPELIDAYNAQNEAIEKSRERYQASMDKINELRERQGELKTAYDTVREAAKQSADSQFGYWDKVEVKAQGSIEDLLGSLDSQGQYWNNYAENIEKAMELGIDKGFLEKLKDGSVESAATLQLIVDDGGEHIDELNEKLGGVEKGKDKFSRQVGEMETDFSRKMTAMGHEMTGFIDELDQSDEARKAMEATIDGFTDIGQGEINKITKAYGRVARTARLAIKNEMQIQSPSKVMEQLKDFSVEGFLPDYGDMRKVYTEYNDMAMAAIEGAENAGRNTALYMPNIDQGYADNRSITMNIQVASASEQDMQQVYEYISRNFATRTGGRM